MKKFAKFIFGTAVLASMAAGAYYIFKTYIKKDTTDDFDDFDDEFEDFDTEEEDDEEPTETREYVSINIEGNNTDNASTDSDVAEA